MNVQREKHINPKTKTKSKNELVRKDITIGIRGANAVLPPFSYPSSTARHSNTAPRYQFDTEASLKPPMGPPVGPPRSIKRKIPTWGSTSGRAGPRVLASDSVPDSAQDFCTPKSRPAALRYISSSSRGGHSGPRSARSMSMSVADASVILAISEGRGMARGEIGIAAVDLRRPHLVLCQFSDSLLYTHMLTKINYFNPVEIIVPNTFCEGVQPNQLYRQIRDQCPLVNLTTVQRRHFNEAAGRQQIQTLCAPQYSSVHLQVMQKFYALTSAAAVLKYVEYIQCIVFARESLKIEYHSSENTMIIDVGTAAQLELVQPLVPSAGPTSCLLGVLGPTYTVGGIRALRAAILQPSCKLEYIENTLDAVQDLIENDTGLMTGVQDVIKKLSDVDRILFLCVESPNQNMEKHSEAQLNQTILLKTTMDAVPKLVGALQGAGSGKLKKIKMDLENPHYTEIADRVRTIIQEDAHLEKGAMGSLQRCFAVKPNINGLLDVARRTYSELIEDIQKIVEQLSETFDLPLRLNQNVMKGFHVVMPLAPKTRRSFNVDDLPPIFIQVHNSGASVSMTTEDLVILDQQAKESLKEIQKMSNIVISSLLKELRPFMSSLYKLCENVAELDILLAMAQASTVGSYVRPEFNSYLEIRNSVHPLLDYNSQVMPVPNDIFASTEHNFTIITGPNMGGKSIYIKQIAIMQIMAQLGCFLPATNAVLRLCDRLFSRIGFNDSVELNASTYVFEMKEVQHILKEVTPSSLVIIDELCRGTSAEEGASMAWAICEELILSEAYTFFTTHFTYLTRLQDLYFNVVNRHAAVTEEEMANTQNATRRLVYQHKIEPGTTKVERYGLALAAKTNLPEDTVKLSMELAEIIAKNMKPQVVKTPERNDEYTLHELNATIRQESRKGTSDAVIRQIMLKFKQDNPQMIERLRVQRSRYRPDNTANHSSTNSTRKESSNEIVSRDSAIESESIKDTFHKQTAATDSRREDSLTDARKTQIRTRPQNLKTIFNGTTDTDQNDTSSNNVPQGLADDVYGRKANKGNDKEIEYSQTNDYTSIIDLTRNDFGNYATVKSSTELLTSVMNDDYSTEENSNNDNDAPNTKTNYAKSKNTNDFNDSSNLSGSKKPNDDEDDDEPMILDGGIVDSDNSDIAEALTQVIEDRTLEDIGSDSDSMSVDEQQLMMETVAEIHEDIANRMIDFDMLLTPPIEFRH